MSRFPVAVLVPSSSSRIFSLDGAVALLAASTGALVLAEGYHRTSLGDAQTASECRYPPVSHILTAKHVRELEKGDMVVLRNVLSKAQLKGVRDEISMSTIPWKQHDNDDDVRQDSVCWVRESDGQNSDLGLTNGVKERARRQQHGDGMIHCIKLLRGVPFLLERHGYETSNSYVVPRQCQLSRYLPGGAGYVRHLDRCVSTLQEMGLLGWLRASDFRHRTVTAILYLNDSEWKDGGQLRCFDCSEEQEGDDDDDRPLFQDVNPAGGTLILFDSSKVEHMVMPSTSDRYALTCWINGTLQ